MFNERVGCLSVCLRSIDIAVVLSVHVLPVRGDRRHRLHWWGEVREVLLLLVGAIGCCCWLLLLLKVTIVGG